VTSTSRERTHPVVTAATPAILNLGISRTGPCGVRDYARVVGRALEDAGAPVDTEWLDLEPGWGPRQLRRCTARWLDDVERRLDGRRYDWLAWHYSVFSYGHAGIPLVARPTARRLAATGVPVVGVLHELAYPFHRSGARGLAFALTQRVALRSVVRSLRAAIVTTDARADWLEGARWLPRRPTIALPVCANVAGGRRPEQRRARPVVGIVGFASESYLVDPVVAAIAVAAADLLLIGAPGPESAQAERWREASRFAGVADRVSFTGVLDAERYADAIASVDAVVFPDEDGPSSRKGTLAAALAAGRPVVAFDGPDAWRLAVDEDAVALIAPDAGALARALAGLLRDDELRRAQGGRAAVFYEREQSPDVLARRMLTFLERCTP
jgi:glycosyltransferase involved in cell wall biosynthesis